MVALLMRISGRAAGVYRLRRPSLKWDWHQHDNRSVAACAMVRIIGHSPPRFSERGARVKPRPFRMLVVEFGDELVLAVGHEGGEIDAILDPLHQRLASVAQPIAGLLEELAPRTLRRVLAILMPPPGKAQVPSSVRRTMRIRPCGDRQMTPAARTLSGSDIHRPACQMAWPLLRS